MTYRYERLTWQEARRAAEEGRVCILPVGSVEQHGPHLPMDVDMRIPTEIALAVGKANPDSVLVLPPICYGYTSHVMDFPGTINTNYGTFIEAVLDVIRSLAYHGFRRVVLLNGHGSNTPCLDIAARRGNLETTATCAFVSWWQLLTIDKAFLQQWRQSIFPGGCSHACELETSLYLHIDESAVRTDLIEDDLSSMPTEGFAAEAMWVDLFAAGAVSVTTWTSRRSRAGVFGQARLATKEKGERAFQEACRQLGRLADHLRTTELPPRTEHHGAVPMPPPWKERPL